MQIGGVATKDGLSTESAVKRGILYATPAITLENPAT
jgi:hypothetical protein